MGLSGGGMWRSDTRRDMLWVSGDRGGGGLDSRLMRLQE